MSIANLHPANLRRSNLNLIVAGCLMVAATPVMAQTPTPAVAAPDAAAPTSDPQNTAPAVSLAEGYVLGPGDIVEVSVLGREEFRPRVQVQTDGTIQLPYLKSVPAADKTVLQLREQIRAALVQGGYYTDPVVAVTVVSFSSRSVTVLGEVGAPGLLPVDRAYRLSEILAKVGGARPTSDDVIELRRTTGEKLSLPLRQVASGGPADDPFVNPGDKIYIAAAPAFYVYGQVNAPGSYKVERGMTIRMALARSGGLSERGSDKKIKVFRDGVEIDRVKLDEPVKGGDTITIGQRFF